MPGAVPNTAARPVQVTPGDGRPRRSSPKRALSRAGRAQRGGRARRAARRVQRPSRRHRPAVPRRGTQRARSCPSCSPPAGRRCGPLGGQISGRCERRCSAPTRPRGSSRRGGAQAAGGRCAAPPRATTRVAGPAVPPRRAAARCPLEVVRGGRCAASPWVPPAPTRAAGARSRGARARRAGARALDVLGPGRARPTPRARSAPPCGGVPATCCRAAPRFLPSPSTPRVAGSSSSQQQGASSSSVAAAAMRGGGGGGGGGGRPTRRAPPRCRTCHQPVQGHAIGPASAALPTRRSRKQRRSAGDGSLPLPTLPRRCFLRRGRVGDGISLQPA